MPCFTKKYYNWHKQNLISQTYLDFCFYFLTISDHYFCYYVIMSIEMDLRLPGTPCLLSLFQWDDLSRRLRYHIVLVLSDLSYEHLTLRETLREPVANNYETDNITGTCIKVVYSLNEISLIVGLKKQN